MCPRPVSGGGGKYGIWPVGGVWACWEHTGSAKLLRKEHLFKDPNTAHRELALSVDNRKVTVVRGDQSYPDHPDRFDSRC